MAFNLKEAIENFARKLRKDKKAADSDAGTATAAPKKPFELPAFLKIDFKKIIVPAVITAVLTLVISLVVANLSFLNIIPRKISKRLPIINKVIEKSEKREAEIEKINKKIEEIKKLRKVGEFNVEMSEVNDIEGSESFIPFLYKMRVIKNKVNEREFAELYVDKTLILRSYVGRGKESPYERARNIATRLTFYKNQQLDFDDLRPKYIGGTFGAFIGNKLLFEVQEEDAVFNNTSRELLMEIWLNNIRIAMGVSVYAVEIPAPPRGFLTHKLKVKKLEEAKKKEKAKKAVEQVDTKNKEEEAAMAAERLANLKKVAKIYEKMNVASSLEVFKKMPDEEVIEIVSVLSVRKVSKIISGLRKDIAVQAYLDLVTDEDSLMWNHKKQFKKMVKVFEAMNAANAVDLLQSLGSVEVLRLLKAMKTSKQSKVLSAMPPELAGFYLGEIKRGNLPKRKAPATKNITSEPEGKS
jgi:flagellar motility protein MotE (MotC chaperone)